MFEYIIMILYVNLYESYEGYRNAWWKFFITKASVSYVHNLYQRHGYLTLTQASIENVTRTGCKA